ncbi:ABC transporter ATP-binding protein [bacterium 210820-DFI.6.37]|nr:ABC transporter ATP-binding protein [bacterium 210820-DFI.6.37]
MPILEVKGLRKDYPAFTLKNVSFSLEKGKITGFIGRNGAGKSTTINALMGFVHLDSGKIRFWDMDLAGNENQIKQRVGFVSSGMSYYPKKRLKTITGITRTFYESWDETAYRSYMNAFALDEDKTPSQLSNGMKIKYALALALSHNADLLILDEPTSGLDPVSREDLLELFLRLCEKGKTILFSTHITSDLDKCADDIIYIKKGQVREQSDIEGFVNSYQLVDFKEGELSALQEKQIIGKRRNKRSWSALIPAASDAFPAGSRRAADLESIMIHMESEGAE